MNKTIINNLKHNSEEAFNLIYKEYYKLIKQICYFYTKDNTEAEDLTIETFIRLWNNRSKLDAEKNFKYYLTQIAHNLCKDHLRKKKREKLVLFDSHELERLVPDNDKRDDDLNDLLREIEVLIDEESYQMLVYRYVHNLKHREIAEIMNVTTSVVTNKIARALKTLKERLNNEKK